MCIRDRSGTIGRNLLNLEFPLEEEMPGGHQQALLALRDSELKDDVMLDAFYDKVITTYLYPENYLILLIHGSYDIPSRSKDNQEMFDASDYVYQFLLCRDVYKRQQLASFPLASKEYFCLVSMFVLAFSSVFRIFADRSAQESTCFSVSRFRSK